MSHVVRLKRVQRISRALQMNVRFTGDEVGLHLVSTNRNKKEGDKAATQVFYQGRGHVYKNTKSSTFFCSSVRAAFHENIFIYHVDTKRS